MVRRGGGAAEVGEELVNAALLAIRGRWYRLVEFQFQTHMGLLRKIGWGTYRNSGSWNLLRQGLWTAACCICCSGVFWAFQRDGWSSIRRHGRLLE